MEEKEIITHTKKVYRVWKNPNVSAGHKLKEIALEIFIIVFAVTLSIGLHNWNEGRHDRHEAHLFLEGLKLDLSKDTIQIQEDMRAYAGVATGFSYFKNAADGKTAWSNDSAVAYQWVLENYTHFNPNNSRFEALKTSGKLSIIADKELLAQILDYYESGVSFVNMQNNFFSEKKKILQASFLKNAVYNDRAEYDLQKMLLNPETRHNIYIAPYAESVAGLYSNLSKKAALLISEIDKELN